MGKQDRRGKDRRKASGTRPRCGRAGAIGPRRAAQAPPSVESIAERIVQGGAELVDIEDPLEAEAWASTALGTFYKVDAPLAARDELERTLMPAVLAAAEAANDAGGLAVLEALAAVADERLAADARAVADRLQALGVPAPEWAAEMGSATFEGAWMLIDVFGDHEAYSRTSATPAGSRTS